MPLLYNVLFIVQLTLLLFVGRELGNNQLEELPEGIFRENTKLYRL